MCKEGLQIRMAPDLADQAVVAVGPGLGAADSAAVVEVVEEDSVAVAAAGEVSIDLQVWRGEARDGAGSITD